METGGFIVKIVKEGNPIVFRFECDFCGCVFEADLRELNLPFNQLNGLGGNYYECYCPKCKHGITKYFEKVVNK
jgi:rubredoxin